MVDTKQEVPRLRLAAHIDLTMADPSCTNCGGTGVMGEQELTLEKGEPTKVPVVCRCVSRAGGVKKDMLDRILEETRKQLEDGTFGLKLAQDVIGLHEPARQQTVAKLARQRDQAEDGELREMLDIALGEIQKNKEITNGYS